MWKKRAMFSAMLAWGFPVMATVESAQSAPEGAAFPFMSDNDLYKEDTGFIANVSEDQFNSIIDAAYQLYEPLANKRGETLHINNNWTDSTVNANCSRSNGRVTVNMYGGMARRPEVTPEAFALVLCHELGHAYGGTPYIHPQTQIAAEGQADYYGAQTCLRALLPHVDDSELAPDSYIESRCRGAAICIRQLQAGQALGTLLAAVQRQRTPHYNTPDQAVAAQTLLSYPRTVQCRLDTFHNGVLGMGRPACWFRS